MFTEQYGTPIGADIVYYATYEDKFYHLKAEFPVEKMKDLVSRAYAISYVRSHKEPLKPYIVTDNIMSYNRIRRSTWHWQWKIIKRNAR